ncbi:MAG: hypothetical protein AAF437_11975 [Pseudomonadota bacterium]
MGRIGIVTIHGTNDSGPIEGEQWWQRNSEFTRALLRQLEGSAEDTIDFEPYIWSGENSAHDREQAGIWLVEFLERMSKSYDRLHIIAHSHGGNVALKACELLNWGKANNRRQIESVSVVGTPFLSAKTSIFFPLLSVIMLALSSAGLALVWWFFFFEFEPVELEFQTGSNSGAGILFSIFVSVSSLYILFSALSIWKRSRTAFRKIDFDHRLSVVWHPQDEAIALLEKIGRLELAPFPLGTFFRTTRNVALIIAMLSLAVTMMIVSDHPQLNPMASQDDPPSSIMNFLVIAPAVFVATYWVFRLAFGALPDLLVRNRLNKIVSGILKGSALGLDSDVRYHPVSPHPVGRQFLSHELEGDLAEQMRRNSEVGLNKLLEKYRHGIFSVGDDGTSIFEQLSDDVETWDALIHTTYFEYDEVVTSIAEHIVNQEARQC